MSDKTGRIVLALSLASIVDELTEHYKVTYEMRDELVDSGDPLAEQAEGLAKGFLASIEVLTKVGKSAIEQYDSLYDIAGDYRRRAGGLGDDNLPVGMYL